MSVKQESLYEGSDAESESELSDDECISMRFKYADSELKPIKSMVEFNKRFCLGSVLGSGGDGDVFRDKIKSWAAIKKIEILDIQDVEYEIKRAQQEQRLLAKGKIANIYGIYYDINKRIMYKIYDRYDYVLDDIIYNIGMKQNINIGMTEYQTKYVIYNICKDIKKLHSQSFIHCDIKPSNILYCKKGTYKRNHNDKQTFKLIDYDGIIFNSSNTNYIATYWQGSIPFSSPEMNDYNGKNNYISYSIDIWNIGLLIIYMINGGHLGQIDLNSNLHKQFYSNKLSKKQKTNIFNLWYNNLFNNNLYQIEIKILYKKNKISKQLFNLLHYHILIKNPNKRMTINQILKHKWFKNVQYDQKYGKYKKNIKINGKIIDYWDAIMTNDIIIKNKVITLHINQLKQNNFNETKINNDQCHQSEQEDDDQKEEQQPSMFDID